MLWAIIASCRTVVAGSPVSAHSPWSRKLLHPGWHYPSALGRLPHAVLDFYLITRCSLYFCPVCWERTQSTPLHIDKNSYLGVTLPNSLRRGFRLMPHVQPTRGCTHALYGNDRGHATCLLRLHYWSQIPHFNSTTVDCNIYKKVSESSKKICNLNLCPYLSTTDTTLTIVQPLSRPTL